MKRYRVTIALPHQPDIHFIIEVMTSDEAIRIATVQ